MELLRDRSQKPLAEGSQGVFTIVPLSGLYTPTRVPKNILDATVFL